MVHASRLFEIRNRFDSSAAAEKLELLRSLKNHAIRSASELQGLHTALCFIRAFPNSMAHYRLAHLELRSFEDRIEQCRETALQQLSDTGIAGTPVHYAFSYEVAGWLARRAPGAVAIDWEETQDSQRIDDILTLLLEPAEDEYFDSGYVSAREWIEEVSAGVDGTDFDWLLAQLRQNHLVPTWSQLYDAADLWLTWDLSHSKFAKSHNRFPVEQIRTRENGLRKPTGSVKSVIMRPLDSIIRLSRRDGRSMIDVAMASLAVRHRETYHFNHANPNEVYVADIGEGVSVAVFGLQPDARYPLECTMGYLILSNGTPVGYGGSSIVFHQVNTGINIFDEYRGSEAAFLWVQVMRVYHELTGCTRFIANPYQFGAENTEALKSGAFWFYYRLGYRPVLPEVRKLAAREYGRIRNDRTYRSDIKTLRRLASCDMHLNLPGARASDLFDEQWLMTSSMLATRILGRAGGKTRRQSVDRVAAQVARDLDLRNLRKWTRAERRAYRRIAPIVAITHPQTWSVAAKRDMRRLLRAKGADFEVGYAQLLRQHDVFLAALGKACRRARHLQV